MATDCTIQFGVTTTETSVSGQFFKGFPKTCFFDPEASFIFFKEGEGGMQEEMEKNLSEEERQDFMRRLLRKRLEDCRGVATPRWCLQLLQHHLHMQMRASCLSPETDNALEVHTDRHTNGIRIPGYEYIGRRKKGAPGGGPPPTNGAPEDIPFEVLIVCSHRRRGPEGCSSTRGQQHRHRRQNASLSPPAAPRSSARVRFNGQQPGALSHTDAPASPPQDDTQQQQQLLLLLQQKQQQQQQQQQHLCVRGKERYSDNILMHHWSPASAAYPPPAAAAAAATATAAAPAAAATATAAAPAAAATAAAEGGRPLVSPPCKKTTERKGSSSNSSKSSSRSSSMEPPKPQAALSKEEETWSWCDEEEGGPMGAPQGALSMRADSVSRRGKEFSRGKGRRGLGPHPPTTSISNRRALAPNTVRRGREGAPRLAKLFAEEDEVGGAPSSWCLVVFLIDSRLFFLNELINNMFGLNRFR
ncbi:hypothetical protein Emag_004032 [Eimeria magna]